MISAAKKRVLNNMNTAARYAQLGTCIDQAFSDGWSDFYFVDSARSFSGDGKGWDTAVMTIQEGVNLARNDANGDLDYTKTKQRYVFVAPGQYNERILWAGYNIHLIGIQPFGNVDYGVVINYDGSQDTTCVMGFSGGSGCSMQNLQINCTEAIPAVFLGTWDGCYLNNLVIKGDGTNCTHGIIGYNVKQSLIENCRISGCDIGIEVGVTGFADDTYFLNSEIRDCRISGNGTAGIRVNSNAVCAVPYGSYIHQNLIVGSFTTGIHQDAAGAYVLVSDNWIQATTAVTDDGTGAADNHTAS